MLKKKTIRQIHKVLLLAVVVMAVLYGLNRVLLYRSFDKTGPEITFDKDFLEVSVEVTEEELLQGVKATDKKDGDVTDTIIIESISKMLEGNQRIVTYAAFDGDNHVGKGERRIQYTDYTSPRFSMEEPLNVNALSSSIGDVLAPLKATDCIDGDISRQIVIVSADTDGLSAGEKAMIMEVQVTNSCGDVAALALPVNVDMSGNTSSFAQIELKKYLIYSKVGEAVDLRSYIKDVEVPGTAVGKGDVKISSELDTSTPGVYAATYSVKSGDTKASVQLYIVVEE